MNKSNSRDKRFERPEKKTALQATFQHNCFITI